MKSTLPSSIPSSFAYIRFTILPTFAVSNNPQDYRPCVNPKVRALRKAHSEMRHGRHTTYIHTDLPKGLSDVPMPVVIGPVVEVIE